MAEQQRTERDNRPIVSAVIPAYNAAETIERALDSVYAQTYDNIIEVIVVDDGSEDNTAEIVCEKYPDVKLIQQENAGNAGARNTGVAAATGEYLAFLDADDEWLPEKTEVQVALMEACPGLALSTCKEIVSSAASQRNAADEDPGVEFFVFRDWLDGRPQAAGFALSVSAWVVRTSVYRSLGGLSEDFEACVDVDFLVRVSAAGYGVAGVSKPLMVRHYQPVSVSRGPGARLRRARMNLKLWRKYDPVDAGQRTPLLSERRFQLLLQKQVISLALAYAQSGDADKARSFAREATGLALTPWSARAKAWAVVTWPTLAEFVQRILRS